MPSKPGQLALDLPAQSGWGGRRSGAGRKPTGEEAGIAHRPREDVDHRTPVHVTLRAREHVWNLRTRRCYAVIARALRGVAGREDFRVVHFTIQGNHVHLIVEADDARALGGALRAFSIRLSRGLNALMRTRGRVLGDRYHAHVLSTPAEVRRALAYVLGNFASHAARRGEPLPPSFVDPFSSAAAVCPDGKPPPVSRPRTWLLTSAERAVMQALRGNVPEDAALPPEAT